MHRLILFIVLFIPGIYISGQHHNGPAGARAIALGNNGVSLKGFWGIHNNQAAVAGQGSFAIGAYLENRYMLKEMNRAAMGLHLPAGRGGLFLGIDHFGGRLYSEMKAGGGYALPFGQHFSAGLQLDYLRMALGEGFGVYHAFTFEGGLMAEIGKKICLGVHVFNPLRVKWSGSREHLPVVLSGGMSFRTESALSLHGGIRKSTVSPAIFSAGCEYDFRKKVFIRAGISSGPASLCFGTGFRLKRMMIDIASSMHSVLGFSTQLSITYGGMR